MKNKLEEGDCMISKIKTICNLAVFKNFEWDKSVLNKKNETIQLGKVNIFYGRNYSGKTTLSRIFRAIETKVLSDKYGTPCFSLLLQGGKCITEKNYQASNELVRVFNEDFVRENLQFINDENRNVVPFAVLGDENNLLEQEIAKLKSDLGSKEVGKESNLYSQLKNADIAWREAKKSYEEAETGLEKQISEKATAGKNSIKYQSVKYGDQNYNRAKLKSEVEKVLSPDYVQLSNEQKLEKENLIQEQAKNIIPPLSGVNFNFRQLCSEVEECVSKKIGASDKIQELLLDVALNQWVQKGYELHKDSRKTCAFCGTTLTDERWGILYRHFDEESQNLELKIQSLILKIKEEQLNIKDAFKVNHQLFYLQYNTRLTDLKANYDETAKRYVEYLGNLISILEMKKERITEPQEFVSPEDISNTLYDVFIQYEELRKESNAFTTSLNDKKKEGQNLLRLREIADFIATIDYRTRQNNIAVLKEKLDTVKGKKDVIALEIEDKEEQIQDKKRRLQDEEKGAVKVNSYLQSFFGHRYLSLEAKKNEEDKKVHFEIIRNGEKAYHLSEGECSLIAFCYFMAKLDDVDTNGKQPIIWIDDPISSLDGNHIFFIYSLIRAGIVKKDIFEQLFVSTHNLEFLKYLQKIKSKSDKGKSEYFFIERKGESSIILAMPQYMKDFVTEFNYLFKEVYTCAKIESPNDENYTSIYNFANNARKFLEIYLYYKYPDGIKSTETDEEKMKRFFCGEIPEIFADRINNEYSHLNGNVERGSMQIEVPEMQVAAKLILDRIKDADKEQYSSFLRSIGEEESFVG